MNQPEKKDYQAPKVEKVHLNVKDSVLATCHTSPLPTAFTELGCAVLTQGCWEGPGGAPGPG